jgi:hypothetical protein
LGSFLKSVKNQLQEILQYNKPDHLETELTLPFFEEKTRIHIFAINDISSYFILIQNLIKAIKNGKISKRLARLIIRRLLRLKIAVDPELIQVAA